MDNAVNLDIYDDYKRYPMDTLCVCGCRWGSHVGRRCPPNNASGDGLFRPVAPAHESLTMDPQELEFRRGLWVNHGCQIHALYGDDGELQCNALGCRHDFLREPLLDLLASLIAEGRLHVGKVR